MQSSKWAEVRLSERREEKGENPPTWRGKRWHYLSKCGWTSYRCRHMGELCLLLIGARGGAKVVGESDYVECVRSEEFRKCVEGKMNPAIVLQV